MRCGFVLGFEESDRQARAVTYGGIPEYVRAFRSKIFGEEDGEYRRREKFHLRNSVPTERWMDGDRLVAEIAFQRLDPEREFDPSEGVICVVFYSTDFETQSAPKRKIQSWNRAANALLAACLADMTLTPKAQALDDRFQAAEELEDERKQVDETVAVMEEMVDTLFPQTRPVTWPKMEPVEPTRDPPPGLDRQR